MKKIIFALILLSGISFANTLQESEITWDNESLKPTKKERTLVCVHTVISNPLKPIRVCVISENYLNNKEEDKAKEVIFQTIAKLNDEGKSASSLVWQRKIIQSLKDKSLGSFSFHSILLK